MARGLLDSFERVFSIDRRSVAAFRIGIGLILLFDLLTRATHLAAHYTDGGAVPRRVVAELSNTALLSIHALSGSLYWQAFCFAVALIAAGCLVVGYRTRIAAVVSWLLLLSLHVRNPYVLNSGDAYLLNLLLWSIFLPLGSCWSLDARRRPCTADIRIVSVATLGVLLQVCAIYFLSVFHKIGPEWAQDFSAVYFALQVDAHATAIGRIIRDSPAALLEFATIGTLILETSGPMLALSPIQTSACRKIAVGGFILFHLGLAATMYLGIFSFVCMAGWLLFIPSEFWNTRAADWKYGKACNWDISPFSTTATMIIGSLCLVMALTSIRLWPTTHPLVKPIVSVAEVFRINQKWGMFAPSPARIDGWYEMTGTLDDGSQVNLFEPGADPVRQKPRSVARAYVDEKWRKFLFEHFRADDWKPFRDVMMEFLVHRWNEMYPDRTLSYAVIRVTHEVTSEYGTEPEITTEVLSKFTSSPCRLEGSRPRECIEIDQDL